jgi:hypothetical protein
MGDILHVVLATAIIFLVVVAIRNRLSKRQPITCLIELTTYRISV